METSKEYKQALNKAVFSDCFEKFIQHPEFPKWKRYIDMIEAGEPYTAGLQSVADALCKKMLKDIENTEDETNKKQLYWTSELINKDHAYTINFDNGEKIETEYTESCLIRPIRKF